MLHIPFYKPSLGAAEIDEVVKTLQSGWLTTGPKTKQFETEFGQYLGQKHAVAVNSCTAALHLALEAIGLKKGQGVLVPTMTFAATAEVVRYFGARPILADCREADFNLDVADAEARIQSALAEGQSVAAIIPVHYGGQIGDVAGVAELAQRYGLKIVEDAAHCCPAFYQSTVQGPQATGHGPGARVPGSKPQVSSQRRAVPAASASSVAAGVAQALDALPSAFPSSSSGGWLPVGAEADITCFSFYANKCITTGEGGMACTQSDEYAERMRIMSLHGISKDAWKRFTAEGSWYYEIIAPGYKYNLTDIASAVGIHQLRRADELHRRRTQWAALYSQLLGDVAEVVLPQQQPNRIHSWHLYPIRLKLDRLDINRAEVISALKQAGVGTSVHWMP
ncbi:MAG: DegT/DnrJ/EryC1/StrS family aminotransferase, partial [Bryobacteraceae bacterium]